MSSSVTRHILHAKIAKLPTIMKPHLQGVPAESKSPLLKWINGQSELLRLHTACGL